MRHTIDTQAKGVDGEQLYLVEWYLDDGSLHERQVFNDLDRALSYLCQLARNSRPFG